MNVIFYISVLSFLCVSSVRRHANYPCVLFSLALLNSLVSLSFLCSLCLNIAVFFANAWFTVATIISLQLRHIDLH